MIYDLIIIGADAAGLTAGIYAGRKKMKTFILTKKLGGQSIYTNNIENYPGFSLISGAELISKVKKQTENFRVPIKEGKEVLSLSRSGDVLAAKTSEEEYQTKTIIVATGRSWRKLNVPGEDKFLGKGVSICTICDAPFYADKDVAVVGGGNAALEGAVDLLKYARKVYLVEIKQKSSVDKDLYDRLRQDKKVEFVVGARTKEIRGGKMVERLIYDDLNTGEEKELKVQGVFVNIGQAPNSSFVEGFLKLNERGEIMIDSKTNTTSEAGVFAAGDVTDIKYKQFVVAAGEGAKAALSAFDYLSS